ncbi:MAG: hypothetical protein WA117_20985 [Verrucomicrobiia bacterium]
MIIGKLIETAVKLCYAAKRGTADGQIVPAEDGTARCMLVAGEAPDSGTELAAGQMADVVEHDPTREWNFKLGGTVTEGDPLMPTTGGVWITGTTGNYCGGIAHKSGVLGDVVPGFAKSFLFKT